MIVGFGAPKIGENLHEIGRVKMALPFILQIPIFTEKPRPYWF
jgi:hypothetical protein